MFWESGRVWKILLMLCVFPSINDDWVNSLNKLICFNRFWINYRTSDNGIVPCVVLHRVLFIVAAFFKNEKGDSHEIFFIENRLVSISVMQALLPFDGRRWPWEMICGAFGGLAIQIRRNVCGKRHAQSVGWDHRETISFEVKNHSFQRTFWILIRKMNIKDAF